MRTLLGPEVGGPRRYIIGLLIIPHLKSSVKDDGASDAFIFDFGASNPAPSEATWSLYQSSVAWVELLPAFASQLFCANFNGFSINIPGLSFRSDPNGDGGVLGGGPSYPSVIDLQPWVELNATLFRFPVLWNYMQPQIDFNLDTKILNVLDPLIENVTASNKTYAIVDIHNYARLNGIIIGQDSSRPYTYDFADLWIRIAQHYKDNNHVIFGLMNEPHDLDVVSWGKTIQYVVNHIRNTAQAVDQYILVPGTDWQGITNWVEDSAVGIRNITDPSNKILYDVHKYFDNEGGASGICDNFDRNAFQPFVDAMKRLGKKAVLTETGGSPNPGCNQTLNKMLTFLEENDEVFMGWSFWGAGLDPTDTLYLDPTNASSNASKGQDHNVDIVQDVMVKHMSHAASGRLVLN